MYPNFKSFLPDCLSHFVFHNSEVVVSTVRGYCGCLIGEVILDVIGM